MALPFFICGMILNIVGSTVLHIPDTESEIVVYTAN